MAIVRLVQDEDAAQCDRCGRWDAITFAMITYGAPILCGRCADLCADCGADCACCHTCALRDED